MLEIQARHTERHLTNQCDGGDTAQHQVLFHNQHHMLLLQDIATEIATRLIVLLPCGTAKQTPSPLWLCCQLHLTVALFCTAPMITMKQQY